jgi:hypothetical protein
MSHSWRTTGFRPDRPGLAAPDPIGSVCAGSKGLSRVEPFDRARRTRATARPSVR